MKKYSIVIAMVLVFAMVVPALANPFSDVPSNHWAYQAVNKLVAAGIITGYADGTFKGKNDITRYEIAVVVTRLLDTLEAERAELLAAVEAGESGLSKEEAKDVNAIVTSLLAKNQPEGVAATDSLTEKQAEEVVELVKALTIEFKPELADLGAKVEVIAADMDAMDARLTALENAKPSVNFSGSYTVEGNHQKIETGDGFNEIDLDSSFYTDPWDDGSDDYDADRDKSITHDFNLVTNISKDDYTANIDVTVEYEDNDSMDDDDEAVVFDDMNVTFENDALKAHYETDYEDIVYSDYAFGDTDNFDGATVEFKNYGLKTLFGTIDGDDIDSYDDIEYYLYGAQKSFDLSGISLDATIGANRSRNNEDESGHIEDALKATEVTVLGLNASTTASDIDFGVDFAYSMPGKSIDTETMEFEDGNNDIYAKLSAASDFAFGSIAFDYRTAGEDFIPLMSNGVIFDTDDDDYDVFEDGAAAGTKAWKLVVEPNLLADLGIETSFKYAAANEEDVFDPSEFGGDSSDIVVSAKKTDLMPGLTVDGSYEIEAYDDNDDEDEKTFDINGEYAFTDYLTGKAGYEMVTDSSHTEDNEKNTFNIGAALADYPIVGALTVSAGFDYETIGGDSVGENDYTKAWIEGKADAEKDQQNLKYNLGLGYTLGKTKLSYDFGQKKVSGDNVEVITVEEEDEYSYTIAEGTYTTNKVGLEYPVTDNTDFTLDYKVYKLVGETKDICDDDIYEVRTATAAVSFEF